ncbi:YdbL family protein [Thorsellia kenyensis]|uniref:YdbL family protein n=1 Tax=Thorsellia kenyensis TaxID=1549888 RepID=A0ABV6CA10_9GAMM
MKFYGFLRLTKTFLVLFFPIFCFAESSNALQDAKNKHLVGESLSGYIEIVVLNDNSKSSLVEETELERFVKNINEQRKQSYQIIADNNHISVEIVANIAGQKLVKNVQPGHYAKGINGQWKLFK